MADINVTINPAPSVSAQVSAAPEVDVTIGNGIPKHAVTHAPGGSDSLESYYATTGSLAYVSGLTTGIGNTGYLTGYVSKSETGDFYPTSNPSGFITGVDLSGYVTGDVVRPSETGAFYPNSNPSGFITGIDLSSYATQSYVTGVSGYLQNQVTNLANSTGSYVTGSVVRPSETGNFITSSQTGQFVSTGSTGVFVTGSVVRPSQTGAFLTTGAADARYALSSATGNFITASQTGVFASQTYVNNVSGHLQTQVTAINNQTGNFALKSQTGSFITTSQTGQFVGTSQTGYYTGIFYPYNSNPLGYVQGAVVRPSQTGAFLTTGAGDSRYFQQGSNLLVYTTGNQLISGNKNFVNNINVGINTVVGGSGNAVIGFGNYISGSNSLSIGNNNSNYNLNDTILIGYANEALSGLYYPPNDPENPILLDPSRFGFALGHGAVIGHSGAGVILAIDPSEPLNEKVLTSGVGTLIIGSRYGTFIRGDAFFDTRPTFNGTGFLLSGEGGSANTGELTGAFYPLNSNPNGYVTGSVVRPSETGSFITQSQTGAFYPASNPSGFITGVDLSNYVTGDVVRPSETGSFITTSQTGQFVGDSETGIFYPASNPSGFITGVDLSAYVTGDVVRPSETGNFVTTAQTGQFVGDSETGAFLTIGAADARYALQSNTGNFITQSQTGQFYAASNPSGFITGVDLSSYATTSYVTGISGDLQNKIDIASGYAVTGYNDSITGIEVTGNLTKTINLFQRDGGVLSASFSDVSGSGGALIENVVYTTGNQDISGLKDFQTRPTVLDIPVLVSGDPVDLIHLYAKNDQGSTIYKGQPVYINGANGNNPLMQLASNTGERTSSKTIGLLAQDLLVNEFGYVITEGVLEGFDTSSASAGDPMWLGTTGDIIYGTGNKPYGNNHLVYLGVVLRAQSNNGKVYVKVQNGFEIDELHRVYAKNPEDFSTLIYNSGSGSWFARQMTTGDVSGINNYVLKSETGSFITTSQTGQFVGDSETGAFLTTGAADGRYALQSQTGSFITTSQTGAFAAAANTGAFLTTGAADNRYALQSATGNFINTSQTGAFAAAANTGAFLTTGAADGRYYGLANGQSISGYAITGYNDAITGMSVTGDSTKTITLFQRDGTNVSANFTDNGGSVSDVVFTTGNQTISGIKTFTGTIVAVSGIIGSTNAVNTANNSSVIAGSTNRITNGGLSAILAGSANVITGSSPANLRSAIIGGNSSTITSAADSIILGGFSNEISGSSYSVIAGGVNNEIKNDSSSFAVGLSNTIRNSSLSCLVFGNNNVIDQSYYSSAFGDSNTISGTSVAHAFGYGTKADRYGIKTFGSDYFSERGDAQNFERTLYANSQNGEVKTLSSDAETAIPYFFNLFYKQSSKIMLATIKVLGVDEDANVSQYMRKAVISVGSTGLQQIKHIESIGTDMENAGKIFFSTNDANLNTGDFASTFCIFGSGLAGNQTRWMAHVNAIELNLPPSYP